VVVLLIGIEVQCVATAKNRAYKVGILMQRHTKQNKLLIAVYSQGPVFESDEGYAKDAGRIACALVLVLNIFQVYKLFGRNWKASTISGQDRKSAILAYKQRDGWKDENILTGYPQKCGRD